MKLLVLDGNSIVNRAFYGIKLLTTKAGDYTNGIYGFLTMLKKLLDETTPDGVAIAFDRKAPTFRHKAYAGYKSNRKGMPQELAQQLPVLFRRVGGHIPQVEDRVLLPHLLVPAADQLLIHLLHCGEGPVFIAEDVPVPKVGVGNEKHAHRSRTSAAFSSCSRKVSPSWGRHSVW